MIFLLPPTPPPALAQAAPAPEPFPLVALPPADAAPGRPEAGVVRPPAWLRRPTAAELRAAYPPAALADGVGGRAQITCVVRADTTLAACSDFDVAGAYPFQKAAASLAPSMRIRPRAVGGRPEVDGRVLITLRFEPADRLSMVPPWTGAPSLQEVRAAVSARTAAAGLGGRAAMRCLVIGGLLNECRALGDPADPFGRAALKLAPKFAVAPTLANGRPTEGIVIDVPVTFDPSAAKPPPPVLENPVRFIHAPSNAQKDAVFPAAARDHGVTRLLATESCVVAPDGSLARCRTTREDPTGLGAAQAAGRLVNAFQLPTWSRDGRPIAGAPVTVDIVWDRAPKPLP